MECHIHHPTPHPAISIHDSTNSLPLNNGISLALATEFEHALHEVSEVPHRFRFSTSRKNTSCNSYLGLVSDQSQGSGDSDSVDNGSPGMTRGPAEVLIAVGVKL